MYDSGCCDNAKSPEKTPQTKEQTVALREEAQLCLELASILNEKLQPLIVNYPEGSVEADNLVEELCPLAASIRESRTILNDVTSILRRLLNRVEI